MSLISNLLKRPAGNVALLSSITRDFVRAGSHYHKNCDPDGHEPRCSEKMLEKNKCKKNPPPTITMISPECCVDPCKDFLPRFDDLYYSGSNKNRAYTQTWVECPLMVVRPKKTCCWERIQPVPFQKRKKCDIKSVASAVPCRVQNNCQCMKVTLPGCKPGRDPPNCLRIRYPLKCNKKCTPYPSYSECRRDKRRSLRTCECFCLTKPPQCMAIRKITENKC